MIKRIHGHWTAGADGIIPLEDDHYNFIVDRLGKEHEGKHPPEAQTPENIKKGSAHYAAHTLNANSYAIGVSMDAMGDAKESPFSTGKYPITTVQWKAFCKLIAKLCIKYGVPVTPQTVLSHAEVQGNLGIKQNGKWDIMWIPGMVKPGNPRAVGDIMRAEVSAYIGELTRKPEAVSVTPPRPTAVGTPTKKTGLAGFFEAFVALFKRG